MGADISTFNSRQMGTDEKSEVQLAQNSLFREYQTNSTMNSMQEELNRWESADGIIATLPLEKQAEYADYVTRKMCDPQGDYKHLWNDYLKECLTQLNLIEHLDNSCAIANLALVISHMSEGSEKESAKSLLSSKL